MYIGFGITPLSKEEGIPKRMLREGLKPRRVAFLLGWYPESNLDGMSQRMDGNLPHTSACLVFAGWQVGLLGNSSLGFYINGFDEIHAHHVTQHGGS
jgi:hypothetical protein